MPFGAWSYLSSHSSSAFTCVIYAVIALCKFSNAIVSVIVQCVLGLQVFVLRSGTPSDHFLRFEHLCLCIVMMIHHSRVSRIKFCGSNLDLDWPESIVCENGLFSLFSQRSIHPSCGCFVNRSKHHGAFMVLKILGVQILSCSYAPLCLYQ